MSVFDDPDETEAAGGRSRLPLVAAGLGLLLLLGILFYMRSAEGPEPTTTVAERAPVETPAAEPTPPPPEPEPSRPAPRARPEPAPEPEPALEPEPAPATTGELRIDSDVPGASVFLDRVYLGTTPVTASGVEPGSHMLNVSASGFDGYAETIEVAAGPADVMIRLKTIRLDESIDVVHRHRMGSCRGRLTASPAGVRYETDHRDRFSVTLDQLQVFEIDYLDKSLRLTPRGGRTYNFSAEDADALFVFHQNVQNVRERLTAGR